MKNKSKYTHKVQFGTVIYDAKKLSDEKYTLFSNKSRQGTMINNGTCWVRHHGVSEISTQTKPYDKVKITPV